MSRIYVLHENDEWVEPLRTALDARKLPLRRVVPRHRGRRFRDAAPRRGLLQPDERLVPHPGPPVRAGVRGGGAGVARAPRPAGAQRQPRPAARGQQGRPVRRPRRARHPHPPHRGGGRARGDRRGRGVDDDARSSPSTTAPARASGSASSTTSPPSPSTSAAPPSSRRSTA